MFQRAAAAVDCRMKGVELQINDLRVAANTWKAAEETLETQKALFNIARVLLTCKVAKGRIEAD